VQESNPAPSDEHLVTQANALLHLYASGDGELLEQTKGDDT
jgi:hypothetical protein